MTSPWIEWNGGENPVPGKMVNVLYRDGEEEGRALRSELHLWGHPSAPGNGSGFDIVKYQIAEDGE